VEISPQSSSAHWRRDRDHLLCRLCIGRGIFFTLSSRTPLEEKIDMVKRLRTYEPNLEQKIPLHFFVKGEPYKLMGLIPWDVHLYGAAPCVLFMVAVCHC